jgi:hypothetical protein
MCIKRFKISFQAKKGKTEFNKKNHGKWVEMGLRTPNQ